MNIISTQPGIRIIRNNPSIDLTFEYSPIEVDDKIGELLIKEKPGLIREATAEDFNIEAPQLKKPKKTNKNSSGLS